MTSNSKPATEPGELVINGKWYTAQVIDGVRYLDGMTIDEFVAQADPMTIAALAMKGVDVLRGGNE